MKNKYKYIKYEAFTLAEITIVLCMVGVLAALLLPAFTGALPDRKQAMFKKAYSVIESTVGELVNDENYYPYNEDKIGFLNGVSVKLEGADDVTTDENERPDYKFCELFASKLNLIREPSTDNENCTIQTSDGISYIFNISDLSDGSFNEGPVGTSSSTTSLLQKAKNITVDINGEDDPNTDDDSVSGRDQYHAYVVFDGRVYVEEDSTESKYLRSTKLNQGTGKTTTTD